MKDGVTGGGLSKRIPREKPGGSVKTGRRALLFDLEYDYRPTLKIEGGVTMAQYRISCKVSDSCINCKYYYSSPEESGCIAPRVLSFGNWLQRLWYKKTHYEK